MPTPDASHAQRSPNDATSAPHPTADPTPGSSQGSVPGPVQAPPVPRWADAVARWTARIVEVYLVWLVISVPLHLIAPGTTNRISSALGILNIPTSPSLFSIVLVLLIANGLRRRLRAAALFVIIVWLAPVILAGLVFAIAVALDADVSGSGLDGTFWAAVALATVSFVVLTAARRAFPARVVPGAFWRALLVLLAFVAASVVVSFALLEVVPSTVDGFANRLQWALSVSVGTSPHDAPFVADGTAPAWLHLVGGLISAVGLALAIGTFLRGAAADPRHEADVDLAVRRLMLENPSDDSLEYFATRDDRQAVFSADGRAAVSYRVVAGVALAAGDPVGDPLRWDAAIERWLATARSYGWTPAVLAASEAGARAFESAGLHPAVMGDEAILETRSLDLAAPSMRAVRHAVARPQKAGYTVRVRRQSEIPTSELTELTRLVEEWRHGEVERGFSMALDRLGDARDPRTTVVTAHDEDGTPRGLLSFVPWGRRGLSLDYMRRSPEAVSGVTELMITTLATEGRGSGVERISLNFAMFREIFESGTKVGASMVQRSTRRVLLLASRWWQLDSLYRSNQKYEPTWRTRYLCYGSATELTPVLVAAGQAEGFLPSFPRLFRRRDHAAVLDRPDIAERVADRVRAQEAELLTLTAPERKLTDQEAARHAKLDVLREAGMEPYPVGVPRTTSLAEARALAGADDATDNDPQTISVVGRVVRSRDLGGVKFAVLRERTDELQVMLTEDRPEARPDLWSAVVDLADHVSVTGTMTRSRTGETTLHVESWTMASKSLKAPPDKRRGLTDPEAKMRLRHVDLALNDTASRTLRGRSTAVRSLRESLATRGFIEVETPILQRVHGGANARPFNTHINAYDLDLYLRIAPELYLKQLAIGGIDRVFELGRNFRNEGADATHNPEFTSLEAYQAFGDYTTMRELTREMIVEAAIAVHGEPVSKRPDGTVVRLDGDWPVVGVHEAISRAAGEEVSPDTPIERVRALCDGFDVHAPDDATHGALITELYDELVEGPTQEPTFYTDFPVETSPLTRVHRTDPRLAERWDLVAFGAELGTAYSELVDPVDQRKRLTEQSLLAAAGDPEAMEVDESFLSALEFAMPPTGGLGIGVDRVYMMLIGASIRETLAFPFVKPSARG
ncbi:lysine--tRNA ligase [Paraoerskovia sediminicola]|uniref:Lysine--tRNA ligase n=1 Tax=Paraoerskovia sediminicola TaxID=1138587 RepID=A0ABM8G4E2_9CELL|nr:bifunctional lysylphosphatidylglycerol synthetase/lysine--tRNA ligase LysX [Paraoerskovia sediminicola]BDZ43047.1 lysine--tRNA ligase [Paraoerskovia sediminicola]